MASELCVFIKDNRRFLLPRFHAGGIARSVRYTLRTRLAQLTATTDRYNAEESMNGPSQGVEENKQETLRFYRDLSGPRDESTDALPASMLGQEPEHKSRDRKVRSEARLGRVGPLDCGTSGP